MSRTLIESSPDSNVPAGISISASGSISGLRVTASLEIWNTCFFSLVAMANNVVPVGARGTVNVTLVVCTVGDMKYKVGI